MSARGRDVGTGAQYFAGALSLVFHSRSPFVPTFRSDIRYFEASQSPFYFCDFDTQSDGSKSLKEDQNSSVVNMVTRLLPTLSSISNITLTKAEVKFVNAVVPGKILISCMI
jgi:hypothetical protein